MTKTTKKVAGASGGSFAFTAGQLRSLSDTVDKLSTLDLEDVKVEQTIEGVTFSAAYGFDDTGTYGLLTLNIVNEEPDGSPTNG